jgi:uncharacterized protein YmfQ (DUF2313 family)
MLSSCYKMTQMISLGRAYTWPCTLTCRQRFLTAMFIWLWLMHTPRVRGAINELCENRAQNEISAYSIHHNKLLNTVAFLSSPNSPWQVQVDIPQDVEHHADHVTHHCIFSWSNWFELCTALSSWRKNIMADKNSNITNRDFYFFWAE